jgi:hypothetical protein
MAGKQAGFAAVERSIEDQGYGKDEAGAILAGRTRKASPAAKKANPRLKRVKSGPKASAIMQKMLGC